jgi:GNAT superfamily N-acetyltransferase
MHIRNAQLGDAPAISNLSAQLGYPLTVGQAAANLSQIIDLPGHAVFVAEIPPGEVVGWLHVYGGLLLEMGRYAEIGGLVVAEDQRGQGVGAALVNSACRWARENGYQALWVHSNTIRQRAHHFYLKLGFVQWKTQAVFIFDLTEGV